MRRSHVLYVDDETVLVFLVTRYLERLGYRVTGASNPVQAVELFRAGPETFDVVVSDLSMPGMSGFELVAAIRESRREVPIVLTSGYVRPADIATAKQLGVSDLDSQGECRRGARTGAPPRVGRRRCPGRAAGERTVASRHETVRAADGGVRRPPRQMKHILYVRRVLFVADGSHEGAFAGPSVVAWVQLRQQPAPG